MNDYQLIVIGAGPGGYTAALKAAGLGVHTAVVEKAEAGGTCLNRGCVPTKAFLHASEIYRAAVSSETAGVRVSGAEMDLKALYAYKRQTCEKLRSGVEGLLKNAGVDFIRGTAQIAEAHTVRAACGPEKTERVLTADSILLATGSVPARPPIPGLELPGVLTSDELLESMDTLYHSVTIMGGGVIGAEFAQFFCDLGCEVTVIEGLDHLLPNMDRELGQNLSLILKKQGVKILTGSMIQRIEQADGKLKTVYSAGNGEGAAVSEMVLCAVGRRPYLEGLFSESIRPEMNGRALKVDENYRTDIPDLYAVGDVSSKIQLAHAAAAQGTACVEKIFGSGGSVRTDIVPGCVYCRPEIAAVGMTEAEAKEAGIPVKVGKCVMFSNARTLISGEGRSFMKVVAESGTGKIIGAQLMCRNSSDMISELSLAVAEGKTADQLLAVIRPHPTYEEALTGALEDLKGKIF